MNATTRLARADEVTTLVDLSRQVQERLTESGSLQAFGPLPTTVVAASVEAGDFWVLEIDGEIAGAVSVAPVTVEHFPLLRDWGIYNTEPISYLSKLMVAPDRRGAGLGQLLLDQSKRVAALGLLVLDCWAGNDKLRDLYSRAGFHLQGVFPEDDYEIAVFTWHAPE